MLTDIEKEKIKLEESYRSEIRSQLFKTDKKSWFQRGLDFLNSSLGLWLLSAIFLSGGIKLYEDYKTKQLESKKLFESLSKLDLEIGYRYSRVLVKLFDLTDKNPDSVAISNKFRDSDVRNVALSLNSSKNLSEDFLYVEYSNFSLLTLIAEEKRVLEQLNRDDEDLNQVINDITGLEVFYEVQKVKFHDIQAVAIAIENYLIIPRWKDNRFYFLDGDENNPFP